MAVKRKKTLAELMNDRTHQNVDTSTYTTKPMQSTSNVKNLVNQVYKPQTSNSTWDRVVAKTNEALKILVSVTGYDVYAKENGGE